MSSSPWEMMTPAERVEVLTKVRAFLERRYLACISAPHPDWERARQLEKELTTATKALEERRRES